MNKLLFAAFAGLLCFCSSCTSDTAGSSDNKGSAQAQKNIAASDAISKAFETGNVSAIDSVVADDFVDHTDRGDKKGRDSLKAMVTMMHTYMKDMKQEKVHEVADDDYVFSWMHYSGTSDGAMGMPKGPFSMNAIEVSKYKDAKAVEHWSFVDMKEMMKMMPQTNMGDMNKMDTSKMKK